jgi:hypothetical protein
MLRTIIILLLVHGSLSAQEKLVKEEVADGVTLRIPSTFINMSSNERIQKFVSSREPLAVYTSEDRFADFAVNQNTMQWTQKDTELIYGFYKASINSLFDEVRFIQDTIREINGKEFIVFEFESVLKDDNVFKSSKGERNYTYIQYTSFNDQVLLFNFGCKSRFKNQWEGTVKEIMESVTIK